MGAKKNRLNKTVFERPKHMFKWMGKKISAFFALKTLVNWPYDLDYQGCIMAVNA